MIKEEITEVKKTNSVSFTREEFAKLGLRAVDGAVVKEDPTVFLLTALVATRTVNTLERLIFGEEDN